MRRSRVDVIVWRRWDEKQRKESCVGGIGMGGRLAR